MPTIYTAIFAECTTHVLGSATRFRFLLNSKEEWDFPTLTTCLRTHADILQHDDSPAQNDVPSIGKSMIMD